MEVQTFGIAQKPGDVTETLESLHKELDALAQIVSALEKRLDSVLLTPDDTENDLKMKDPRSLSPLADKIYGLQQMALTQRRRLEMLLEAIQL